MNSPTWKRDMTLWIGVDYIDQHYIVVGIEQFQIMFQKRLSFSELNQELLNHSHGIYIVKIPGHAMTTQNVACHLNSNMKDCEDILKHEYGSTYHQFVFRFFYLGQQFQQDIWRVARVSIHYFQEYMIRYGSFAHKIQIIESDLIAVWLWIYVQFKEDRIGAVIYKQGEKIQALIGRNELIVEQITDSCLEKLIGKLDLISFDVQWICFFNVPVLKLPRYEIKCLDMDILWRMPMALAYRGACFGI